MAALNGREPESANVDIVMTSTSPLFPQQKEYTLVMNQSGRRCGCVKLVEAGAKSENSMTLLRPHSRRKRRNEDQLGQRRSEQR
jgi:hypothetical protein